MEKENISFLIVDDDVDIRRTFGQVLKLKGYSVEDASTASEAYQKARGKFFNIAVIDVRMPDSSGLEILKGIREINEETIVIMITAYVSADSTIEALNKGAYSYITKPVNMDEVLAVIDKALEKQRLSIENKRLLKELKEANEKLKEMDKRKSTFVANVSHEFRSPLTIIRESLMLVIDGTLGEISLEQRKMLETGRGTIDRLIRLATDLLDVSKIESGKVEMKRREVDIVSLAEEIITGYKEELLKKQINFTEDISSSAGIVWADRDKLTEVIMNLLNNAIKYTPEKENIGVKIYGDDKEVRFEIYDSGPGIAKEYFEKIFDKFERITAEKQEGTGLGLPIAKDIVELHKGRIWVESEVGKGSRFIFTLPRDLRRDDKGRN
ncbi:MAG: hybrid sensor histidine kinase/response regulator [Candidatus Omnitrophota bacterium]